MQQVIDTVLDFSRPELERAAIRVETNYEKVGPKALADENQLPLGSAIFQPGLLDGGHNPQDKIAVLSKFIPLKAGVPNKVVAQ